MQEIRISSISSSIFRGIESLEYIGSSFRQPNIVLKQSRVSTLSL